ncbi:hypothetical protein [Paenirhodobacter sp. CAU 1674]|uniref:hypothetical protein n=1 Tax=Paenirhodobacter sp. CAU 1674 TaxID=3032596 RepID=UPI0023DCA0BA|nr:hypothetical protein [Paenirhodobacter sp. CAU 1674]MDF2141894.1 hypothetical protein [Paenirhodobacter sp. CAU 1674]
MHDAMEQTTEALMDLLRAERHAITHGEFEAILQTARRKESLMAALADAPDAELGKIREMAHENQRLLNAALKGIRAAQRRLKIIMGASKSFNSYDGQGRARTINPDTGSVERRA